MALRRIIITVILVFSSISCITAMYCEKIDFNRIAYEKIQQCTLQNLPKLEIKNYAATTNVRPFRPNSSYYLSTVPIGYSCSQTTKTYTLNERTRIEAAIFLKSFEYANVEIAVYDVDLRQKMHSWMIGASDGKPTSWFVFHGEVAQNISNAVVEIKANVTPTSIVAIEYLNILNSGIQSPDCSPNTWIPTPPPSKTPPCVNDITMWVTIVVCESILLIVFLIIVLIHCFRQHNSPTK